MKTKILLSILYLSTLAGYVLAQLPGFNYQAVLRGVDGEPMPNADVKIFFNLTDGPDGPVLYRESHSLTTNDLGMINTMVGTGNVEMGTYADIVSVENLNIKLQAEIPGEPNIVDVGFGVVGAVPYALYGEDADADPENEMQSLSLEGDSLKIDGMRGVGLESVRSKWRSLEEGVGYELVLRDPATSRIAGLGDYREEIRTIPYDDMPVLAQNAMEIIRKIDQVALIRTVEVLQKSEKIGSETLNEAYEFELFGGENCTIKLQGDYINVEIENGSNYDLYFDEEFGYIDFYTRTQLQKSEQLGLLNAECEIQYSTDLQPDGISQECGFEATSSDFRNLITTTEKGETQYTCSYTSTGDVVQTFNDGATWTFGQGGCQYANPTGEVLCESGEMGDGAGAAVTYTNGAPTTICTDATAGSGNGIVLTFNGGQASTSCSATSEGGGDISTFGTNNSINTRCSSPAGNPNVGFFSANDAGGVGKALMFVNNTGQGVLQADVKNFVMDHPTMANMKIVYASLEGPEAAAYDRGTAILSNGEVFVEFPEHFQHVADPNSMTVMLTPLSADSEGLAVIEKTNVGFRIKELHSGKGNYSFDWEVKCKRKGFENFKVIQEAIKAAEVNREMPKEIRRR